MTLWLELTLKSDTCLSGATSHVPDQVDADIELDPTDRLPVVRGRTLKGLFREQAAALLSVLEPAGEGSWYQAALRLFGESGAAESSRLWWGDARLPAAVRAAGWRPEELVEAVTVIRGQTRINARTGAAEAGSLRNTRLLRAGLCLRAPLEFESPVCPQCQALLAGCAAGLRRVGLHRSRGWGEVQARLFVDTRDVTAAWLSGLTDPGSLSTLEPGREPAPAADRPAGPEVVSYRLELEAPLLLGDRTGEPTLLSSLDYVSGASVLGAAAARWLAEQDPSLLDPAAHPEFVSLFLDGSTRWLNAYPEGRKGQRLLPRPASLAIDRDRHGPVHDRACEGFRHDDEVRWGEPEELAYVDFDFEDEPRIVGRRPAMAIRLHHQRDAERGRSVEGGLFSYRAVDRGECFVGQVCCEKGEDAATLARLLRETGRLRLGKSRSATYGMVRIVDIQVQDSQGWREAPDHADQADGDRLVVTLLSDYLGRSADGLADSSSLVAELGLGDPVALFLRHRDCSGYVSAWRMPRPTCKAVGAGSVLVYARPALEEAARRRLEWQGLGERKAEGFGRVTVGWHGAGQLRSVPLGGPSTLGGRLDPSSGDLAWYMHRMVSQGLSRVARRLATEDARAVRARLTPSLVVRLRNGARTAPMPGDLSSFLRDLQGKPAGNALRRGRLGTRTLGEHLKALVERQDWLERDAAKAELKRLGLRDFVLPEAQRWQLTLLYLDTFLGSMHRRAQEARS